MADLIDGAVATGEGAFRPRLQTPCTPSPVWPEDLPEDDEDNINFPLDPTLKGAGGRVVRLPTSLCRRTTVPIPTWMKLT
jgi:hypothetical protein